MIPNSPSPKTQPETLAKKTCDVPGCRGLAIHRTLCRICAELITRKDGRRFRAAIGAANKLRYYQKVLVPTLARRHQHRGEN